MLPRRELTHAFLSGKRQELGATMVMPVQKVTSALSPVHQVHFLAREWPSTATTTIRARLIRAMPRQDASFFRKQTERHALRIPIGSARRVNASVSQVAQGWTAEKMDAAEFAVSVIQQRLVVRDNVFALTRNAARFAVSLARFAPATVAAIRTVPARNVVPMGVEEYAASVLGFSMSAKKECAFAFLTVSANSAEATAAEGIAVPVPIRWPTA